MEKVALNFNLLLQINLVYF